MTGTRDAADDLADALGVDLTYLQPPDEQRFDPVSVAVLVGLWVLHAAADGIRDGITEAARDGTKDVLSTVGSAIKDRVPARVRDAFARTQSEPPTEDEYAETETALSAARAAVVSLDPDLSRRVPEAVAAAVREALLAQGLPPRAAGRVEQVLRVEVHVALTGGGSTGGFAGR